MKIEGKARLIPFDAAEYLDSPEAVAEYLTQVLADGDSEELLRALGHVAKARGMSEIAAKAGVGRESLYKTLRADAKPRFETIEKVMRALGVQLTAKAVNVA